MPRNLRDGQQPERLNQVDSQMYIDEQKRRKEIDMNICLGPEDGAWVGRMVDENDALKADNAMLLSALKGVIEWSSEEDIDQCGYKECMNNMVETAQEAIDKAERRK